MGWKEANAFLLFLLLLPYQSPLLKAKAAAERSESAEAVSIEAALSLELAKSPDLSLETKSPASRDQEKKKALKKEKKKFPQKVKTKKKTKKKKGKASTQKKTGNGRTKNIPNAAKGTLDVNSPRRKAKGSKANTRKKTGKTRKKSIPDVTEEELMPQAVKAQRQMNAYKRTDADADLDFGSEETEDQTTVLVLGSTPEPSSDDKGSSSESSEGSSSESSEGSSSESSDQVTKDDKYKDSGENGYKKSVEEGSRELPPVDKRSEETQDVSETLKSTEVSKKDQRNTGTSNEKEIGSQETGDDDQTTVLILGSTTEPVSSESGNQESFSEDKGRSSEMDPGGQESREVDQQTSGESRSQEGSNKGGPKRKLGGFSHVRELSSKELLSRSTEQNEIGSQESSSAIGEDGQTTVLILGSTTEPVSGESGNQEDIRGSGSQETSDVDDEELKELLDRELQAGHATTKPPFDNDNKDINSERSGSKEGDVIIKKQPKKYHESEKEHSQEDQQASGESGGQEGSDKIGTRDTSGKSGEDDQTEIDFPQEPSSEDKGRSSEMDPGGQESKKEDKQTSGESRSHEGSDKSEETSGKSGEALQDEIMEMAENIEDDSDEIGSQETSGTSGEDDQTKEAIKVLSLESTPEPSSDDKTGSSEMDPGGQESREVDQRTSGESRSQEASDKIGSQETSGKSGEALEDKPLSDDKRRSSEMGSGKSQETSDKSGEALEDEILKMAENSKENSDENESQETPGKSGEDDQTKESNDKRRSSEMDPGGQESMEGDQRTSGTTLSLVEEILNLAESNEDSRGANDKGSGEDADQPNAGDKNNEDQSGSQESEEKEGNMDKPLGSGKDKEEDKAKKMESSESGSQQTSDEDRRIEDELVKELSDNWKMDSSESGSQDLEMAENSKKDSESREEDQPTSDESKSQEGSGSQETSGKSGEALEDEILKMAKSSEDDLVIIESQETSGKSEEEDQTTMLSLGSTPKPYPDGKWSSSEMGSGKSQETSDKSGEALQDEILKMAENIEEDSDEIGSKEDTESELEDETDDSPVCQHIALSGPSSYKWVCGEGGEQDFGDSCFLKCRDDNKIPDSPIVSVCTPEGWIPHPKKAKDFPRCVPAPCPNLHNESLENGLWDCSPRRERSQCAFTQEGTVCKAACSDHYSPAGAIDTTVCTANGWHPRPESIRCEMCAQPKLNNGTWDCTETKHGKTKVCHLKCDKGYEAVTPRDEKAFIECVDGEDWSPDPKKSSCVAEETGDEADYADEAVCEAPEKLPLGVWELSSDSSSALLKCPQGFATPREVRCHCSHNNWCCGESAGLGCVPECQDPPPEVAGGKWECRKEPFTSCSLSCSSKKTLVGGGLALCGLGGIWTFNNSRCSNCAPNALEDEEGDCKCQLGFTADGSDCRADRDFDGVPDKEDNCKEAPNSGQEDEDEDGKGDSCDPDIDGDEVNNMDCGDRCDNCPYKENENQEDSDHDGFGDVCDNCPEVFNQNQTDVDNDGKGDACDEDIDGDQIENKDDECPRVANIGRHCKKVCFMKSIDHEAGDQNANFVLDSCEEKEKDLDADGVMDKYDNCPHMANVNQLDTDNDNAGDACDDDKDDDNIENVEDNCPLVKNKDQKTSKDSVKGLACLDDEDGDGVKDKDDMCMDDANIKDSIVFRHPSSVNLCADCNPLPDTPRPNSTSPVWVTRGDGREVVQLANSRATIALGVHRYTGVDFSGTLYVADKEDDDWVGLVFSYQSANTFYALLSAKHCCGPTLSPGQRGKLRRQGPWRLVRVNSTTGVTSRTLAMAVVALRSVRDQTMVLWTDPQRQGWNSQQPVRWMIQHRPQEARMRIRLFQGGKEIVDTGVLEDVEGLMGGRLGLFCKSQENVIWSHMEARCSNSDIDFNLVNPYDH